MTLQIRILGRGDETVLSNVADGVFDDVLDPARAREFLEDPRHHLAVAVDAGEVVGFASGVRYVHPDKPHPELWINEVGVAPAHQGRGIAKSVVRALLEFAREAGCSEAWVLTDRRNTPAMRLYASVGGTEEKDQPVLFTFRLREDDAPRFRIWEGDDPH